MVCFSFSLSVSGVTPDDAAVSAAAVSVWAAIGVDWRGRVVDIERRGRRVMVLVHRALGSDDVVAARILVDALRAACKAMRTCMDDRTVSDWFVVVSYS